MITTPDRRKLFRPSAAPGKELCSHFEPTISTSPNAARGTEIHDDLAKRLPAFFNDPARRAFIDGDKPYLKYALRILDESGLKKIWAHEELVELRDSRDGFITEGTVDLYGYNESTELMVYDWKTGQERDYSAQVILYTLALMQRDKVTKAWVHEVFLDQERTYRTEVTREIAEERIFKIVENARDPRAPHVINKFCDYCDLQHDCPAWLFERKRLMDYLPMKSPNGGYTLESRLAYILEQPETLAAFVSTFKRMEKYVKKAQINETALTLMKNGTKLTGLRLANHPSGSQYVALE